MMSDWLHDLPLVWMALTVLGGTCLVTAAIYAGVMALATGERARTFKAMSPGMLPPLGIIFGLFIAFTAAQVWNDTDRAAVAVGREANALSGVLFLAASFPGEPEAQMRKLVRDYIEIVATQGWPRMAQQRGLLGVTPQPIVDALKLALAQTPATEGQEIAQREIIIALGSTLEARRQRIMVSESQVNAVKWSCLLVQAICMLIGIAMVHCDNRRTAAIAMGLFGAGVAVSVMLILAHDRPFTGKISIGPDTLLQVMPEIETGRH